MVKSSKKQKNLITLALYSLVPLSLGLGFVLLGGYQSLIRNRLGKDSVLTGCISYAGGLIICTVLVSPPIVKLYAPYTEKKDREPFAWWHLIGGLCGGVLIVINALVSGTLEFLVHQAGVDLAMILFSYTADHLSLLGIPTRRLNMYKMLAVIIFFIGLVFVAMKPSGKIDLHENFLGSLVVGLLISVQTLFNKRVANAMPYAPQATFLNYVVGTAAILCVYPIYYFTVTHEEYTFPNPWHVFMSVVIPPFIVLGNFTIAAKMGMGLYFMFFIIGTLASSFVIDRLGFFKNEDVLAGEEVRGISWTLLLGLGLTTLGAGVSTFGTLKSDKEAKAIAEDNSKKNETDGFEPDDMESIRPPIFDQHVDEERAKVGTFDCMSTKVNDGHVGTLGG